MADLNPTLEDGLIALQKTIGVLSAQMNESDRQNSGLQHTIAALKGEVADLRVQVGRVEDRAAIVASFVESLPEWTEFVADWHKERKKEAY